MKLIDQEKARNLRTWLEALRSGEYRQNIDGILGNHEGGFCCLGVACKVLDLEFDWNAQILPELPDYIGLYDEEGNVKDGSIIFGDTGLVYSSLIEANDSGNVDFDEIADAIEENLIDFVEPAVAKLYKDGAF